MSGSKMGPLLSATISRLSDEPLRGGMIYMAASPRPSGPRKTELPVVIQLPHQLPKPGEMWEEYAERIEQNLAPLRGRIEQRFGKASTSLLAAGGMSARLSTEEIQSLSAEPEIELMELDPIVKLTALDDCQKDIGLADFQIGHPTLTGRGVTVALLDTGVDSFHPALKLSAQESVVNTGPFIPGRHGTICAGILASRDEFYPGVAPEISLVDIQVLNSDGTGSHSNVIKGIELAMKSYKPQVISISLAMNHIPQNFQDGHGWSCPDGKCPLCRAVESVLSLTREAPVVVVAAGNVHQTAESLRKARRNRAGFLGKEYRLDTEICCPGQVSSAITVGAITKNPFMPAEFSSRGPTAFKTQKPDICAPGVNITSTIPLPRNLMGKPVIPPKGQRDKSFGRESGTSMSTPFVAGIAALLIQKKMEAGESWTPVQIKQELLAKDTRPMDYSEKIIGCGRLWINET